MSNPSLNPSQLRLLRWLAREDMQQYGECYGPTLNALHRVGFVRTTSERFDPDFPDDQPPADWPPPLKFCAVNLTQAARDFIKDHRIDIWADH